MKPSNRVQSGLIEYCNLDWMVGPLGGFGLVGRLGCVSRFGRLGSDPLSRAGVTWSLGLNFTGRNHFQNTEWLPMIRFPNFARSAH